MELPYEINFVGFGTGSSGDVITKDGEYLGRWETDENDHPSFTPDGHDSALFENPFLGLLIEDIRKWHKDN